MRAPNRATNPFRGSGGGEDGGTDILVCRRTATVAFLPTEPNESSAGHSRAFGGQECPHSRTRDRPECLSHRTILALVHGSRGPTFPSRVNRSHSAGSIALRAAII